MRTYDISENFGETVVFVLDGKKSTSLTPAQSLTVRSHSPSGFNYGFTGSGPAQLSLAILLDHFGHMPIEQRLKPLPAKELAEFFYQKFKSEVIAAIPPEGGTITEDDINKFLSKP